MTTTVKDVTHISGDPDQGIAVTHHLDKMVHASVTMVYTGQHAAPFPKMEITCEVYKAGDVLSVHTVCPKCRHAQWIDGRNKQIEYDPDKGLFIESFGCPWEMDETRKEFGMSLCGLRLTYAGRVVREA